MGALRKIETIPTARGRIIQSNIKPVPDIIERQCIARLTSEIERAFLNDVWIGEVSATATASNAQPSDFTLEKLQETIEQWEVMQRQSPFQFSKFMPEDAEHAVKVDGKLYFGKKRWDEFKQADRMGESATISWLMTIKILDLDKLAHGNFKR